MAIEPLFESIAAHSPDAIMLLDREGRIRFINWTAPGLEPEQVVGTLVYDHVPEEQHRAMRECFARVAETGRPDGYDNVYTSPDGLVSHWESRVGPISEDGEVTGFVVFSSDVTERRALEAQLFHAQKMDAIGQLAGGIAHDFNNLLMSILTNAEFGRRTDDPERSKTHLQEISAAGERAAALTRQLLSFSRRQPMRKTQLDLNEVIRELLRLARRVIPEDIQIDFIAGHELAPVQADRSQIEQVLMNLCVNARDAMPDGGRITVETENVLVDGDYRRQHPWAKAGRYVLLAVTDTGTGMTPEVRDHVFEPFFTTKSAGEGTGLGLSTVYGIVQQHEGMVHVYSELGEGTTFKVYLPVTVRPASSVGTKIEPEPVGGAETLLLAEDDPLVRKVVVAMLERAGYHVIAATDGRDAVERCREDDSIALAILDVVMPKLSGPDAARQMHEARPSMPVLYTSGYNAGSRAGDRLPENAVVITKPYRAEALLETIREMIDASA